LVYIVDDLFYMSANMPLNVNNPEADALTRKFAQITGVNITQAIIIAMKEAIRRRQPVENPREAAARLRKKHGVQLNDAAREPLPKTVFDDMWN
jgi:antitoxin VapB